MHIKVKTTVGRQGHQCVEDQVPVHQHQPIIITHITSTQVQLQ